MAPIGGDEIGPNPTDRAKSGTKESLLVDRQGGPLSIVVAPANINDHLLLEETIESIVVERPEPTEKEPQHLCLDAGYNNALSKQVVKEHGYEGNIRPNGAETLDKNGKKKYLARRWVVERTIS
jgi:putative transposase